MVYGLHDEGGNEDWSRLVGRSADLLIEHAVGNEGDVFPQGTGRLLKGGAKLLVQVHYHPHGVAATDRTEIGFKFYDDPSEVSRRVVAKAIVNFDLRIPAGSACFEHVAWTVLDRPIGVVAFQPHMHYRGRTMRLDAFYPDGRQETLFSAPRYDANWQMTYAYKTPPILPAGTRLRVTGTFDNSAANPLNPDPTVSVSWGPRADDEMMIGWMDFYFADEEG
jgi:hypothetical protein